MIDLSLNEVSQMDWFVALCCCGSYCVADLTMGILYFLKIL